MSRNNIEYKSNVRFDLNAECCVSNPSAGKVEVSQACAFVDDPVSWFSFIRDRRWSRSQKYLLLERYGSLGAVLGANEADFSTVVGGRRRSSKPNIDIKQVQAEVTWLEATNHHLISCFDARYPTLLREIIDPPIALYASGNIDLLNSPKVAIVGSRRPSPAGVSVARQISSSLAELGVSIVSGLAYGIDAVAHEAALSGDGPSIAVTGCGIDVIYPARHQALYQKMLDGGLILSEYPMGLQPSRYTFPDRNRLVSGLCDGVIIIEAAERSGTLITARLATEQNRELMVVPGPALSPQYAGSHRLIKDGAALVCHVDDVVELLFNELDQHCKLREVSEGVDEQTASDALTPLHRRVLEAVDYEPTSIDSIAQKSELTSSQVAALLLELELDAMVAATLEGGYIRVI